MEALFIYEMMRIIIPTSKGGYKNELIHLKHFIRIESGIIISITIITQLSTLLIN